ncbi:MAG: ATP-dependent sacrificial sulfur transferase LarE [Oscillospiraceae bacterium]|nr:ATP-dependent sacrificial sulfur transferase LarE [Oscillospiraceae bacterium]
MELNAFFEQNPSGALAFSGGVDSSLLVWAAAKYGQGWHAYYVHSAFQPAFELEDARRVAEQCGMPLTIIEGDILQYPEVTANPADRCYYCKRRIFSAILRQAAKDGHKLVIDGTNASDDADDRPGMRALRELEVRSPLRECGLTKSDVRTMCREADLFVWNKPSYACLATRIPAGTPITEEALRKVERGEDLLASMGFRDFRIRLRGGAAVIQVTESQQDEAWERRKELLSRLTPMFPLVSLDLAGRTCSD